jgi:hypothetical protein
MDSKVLDVGCGEHCLPGAIGIDVRPMKGVSVVHNLNTGPWPFPSGYFHKVRCQHVIEHLAELHLVVQEMHRICVDGAEIEFRTPHYSSCASWGDPTHRHHFALGSIPQLFEQALGKSAFSVVKNQIHFTGAVIEFPGILINWLSPKQYEKHYAWIFPANEIRTTIRINKTP